MTGEGHTLTGLTSGLPLAYLALESGTGIVGASLCLAACTIGATAPDWMEIPYRQERKGKDGKQEVITRRVLKHRGVTHIFSLWLAAFLWVFMTLRNGQDPIGLIEIPSLAVSCMFGFCGGGVIHLLGDIPNKQKIPIFTTWDGFSLNIWQSGKYERTTGLIILLISGAFTFYNEPILLKLNAFL